MPRTLAIALLLLLVSGPGLRADELLQIPIRGVPPEGTPAQTLLPFCGGIPLPRGSVRDTSRLRVVDPSGREVPAQVRRLAVWPDGSVKWALLDLVARAGDVRRLRLVHDPKRRRAAIRDGLRVRQDRRGITVSGGGVTAYLSARSRGVLDALALVVSRPDDQQRRERVVIRKPNPLRLVVDALRLDAGSDALPVGRFTATGADNSLQHGVTRIDAVSVEAPGPIRATIRIRGHVLLPALGKTLPAGVRKREPAGRLPFTLRLSFHRFLPLVSGQTQLVFSGEPDADFIARWALQLPGPIATDGGAASGITVLEPGVELVTTRTGTEVRTLARRSTQRLVHGSLAGGGFALIRHGWENRPAAVTHEAGSTFLDFWPARAGVWDLRRYAREWAVGETGARREKADDMLRFARYAARGLAKSHDFVLNFAAGAPESGDPESGETDTVLVRAHGDRALLVASPAWVVSTGVLGPCCVEQTRGPLADLDAALRRTLDYYLFNQELYRWHGKLAYGFWQTRNGNIHRTDRWERDYGRWGWALGDGAGRIPHALMLAWLRTGERRYLTAGEAAARAVYDTSMVHTVQHLENATRSWWTVTGCNHRHNVQPFGGPYIGMRGSAPGGARLLYLLTGDGVIKDGLDLVVEAATRYLGDQPYRLGASGGSDGQGAGANALLFAFESSGESRYLDLVRRMLDKSGLIPPVAGKRIGYGPAFGLFHAAVEYADLTADEAFRKRVVATARLGLGDQKRRPLYLPLLAAAYRYSGEAVFRDAVQQALPAVRKSLAGALPRLPAGRWPGHGGARSADPRANLIRDLPAAMVALGAANPSPQTWPQSRPSPAARPAALPRSWPRPGGHPGARDRVLAASELLKTRTRARDFGRIEQAAQAVSPGCLRGPVEPFAIRVLLRGSDDRDGVALEDCAATLRTACRITPIRVEGRRAFRVQSAVAHSDESKRLLTWGLRLPLALGPDRSRIQVAAGGGFRTERWRVDMNDEQIPDWLTSDVRARWPLWRLAGLRLGPAGSYRIWRANRSDTSALVTDQGFHAPGWIDVSDRGAGFGVSVRLLPPADPARVQAVRLDLERGRLEIQFHDEGAAPLAGRAGGYAGACDIVFHDGWRPPFSTSLTRAQFARLLADLDFGENHGLFAYRLRLARTHKARGPWAEKILQSGVEPHELLAGMEWRGALQAFCRKVGVRFDPVDPDAAIQRVVRSYRRK